MKSKPFQFRYVNEIVGGFVLLVVALLMAAVIVAGRAQGWFEPVYKVEINFPPQGSLDLQVGSPVKILGATVGRVEMIEADDEGFMTGQISIKGTFYQYVRSDSEVIVKKTFGIAGDAFLDISRGVGPELPPGAGLVARKDTDLNELLEDLLSQVRGSILPLLDSVKTAADEYTGLASDLRVIIQKIEAGEGPAGLLVSDEATARKIEELLNQVQAILTDVRGATIELPPMARTVNREVQDLPGTVLLTQETLRETERLIEGIQRHWLLRKYVQAEAPPTPLIPAHDIPRNAASAPAQENAP
jgi:phospholipid/cholesterol/gamma-HCH transport system substrate-binding protein